MTATRLLIVEDNPDDAELIAEALHQAGISCDYQRVETADALAKELPHRPAAVLCDYSLPGFSAEEALKMVHAADPDTPFILVSGYVGEDAAISLMRAGARDFIHKDALNRLEPALARELAEARGRRQRREAEHALRSSEARFRLLAEHAQDAIFRCELHPTFEVTYISPAAQSQTGYLDADLLGPPQRIFDHIADPADRAAFEASWRQRHGGSTTVRWRRPDGSIAWLEHRAQGIHEAGQLVAVAGTLRDITEQILAERERELLVQQLEQNERIDSLGVLAGGVAHDFNNSLAVILNSASMVLEDLPASHPSRPDVERVINAANRSAALTRKLLLFARKEPTNPQDQQTLQIDTLVAGLEDLLRRASGEDVAFTFNLTARSHLVILDPNQLEQVIINLVANARAAMPDGGSIRISTSKVTLAEADGIDTGPGDYIRLSVADTGNGMPPEVLAHALEPFFTTKSPGQGTGLGLSIAYGVARQAGGCVTLDSSLGHGTTIDLYLPVAAERQGQ